MSEQIKFKKEEAEVIWECQDCDVKAIAINGRRKFETKQGIKPFTKSWDNYLMLTRGCNHENKVYGENYCRICGRKLTNSKSIDRAIGPVCWHHPQKARADMIIAKEIREREVH
ncbi:MAG: DUF6011 domain-containing protein [Nitrososphaerales archaeon]